MKKYLKRLLLDGFLPYRSLSSLSALANNPTATCPENKIVEDQGRDQSQSQSQDQDQNQDQYQDQI